MSDEDSQNKVTYLYDAFISYSHVNAELAERLSKRIRRYRAPRQTKLKKRQLTVFRDVERLTSSSVLSEELRKNVAVSSKMVLLASPDSATSEYVDDEVGIFLQNNSINSVIIALVDGEFLESIPPKLAEKIAEPLYIELHKTDRKSFRLETLRIIAALFGVDYAELRREDEALRRRRRNAWISGTIMTIFLIASIFLINTVSPEVWTRIPQPQHLINLMPVHEIAVNKNDPSIILYHGFDANWATNPVPSGYYFTEVASGAFESGDWDSLQAQSLQHLHDKTDTEIDLIAKVEFDIEGRYDGQTGSGVVRIYPVINPNTGELDYVRTLEYKGITEDSLQKTLILPGTLWQAAEKGNSNPFDLYPWPIDTLAKLNLYSYNTNIKTSVTNLLSNEKRTYELEPREAADGFWEWAAIWNPANVVFSNRDSETLVVLKDTLSQIENEDDLWLSIKDDNQWIVWNKTEKLNLGSVYENDEEDITKIIQKLPNAGNERDLVDLFKGCLKGEYNQVYLIQDTISLKGTIVEFTGAFDTPGQEEAIPEWLFRSSDGADWVKVKLPVKINPKLRVLDVRTLTKDGSQAILLTNSEGFFRTLDGGQTWEDINFGETSFSQGEKLKVILSQSPFCLYVLADRNRNFSEGENPLFSLKKRNWLDRWRTGIVELLKD